MEGLLVNENQQVNGSRGAGSSVAMGFLLGAVVGAGVALLLAPEAGKKTRHRIADAGRRWRGAARDMVRDLKQEATSALDAARDELEHGLKHETPSAPTIERKA
jgi:gas vesicle protein